MQSRTEAVRGSVSICLSAKGVEAEMASIIRIVFKSVVAAAAVMALIAGLMAVMSRRCMVIDECDGEAMCI